MVTILSRFLIQNSRAYHDPKVRKTYGMICSSLGIGFNVFLFLMKLVAGFLTSSVAIFTDAFNNLSDAGSSVISLVGIVYAEKKPDAEHPFGHGRIEYLAGFLVSVFIILLGIELFITSVEKILHPVPVVTEGVVLFILILSILIKSYMVFYNYQIGKKIDSVTLRATALDSLSDAVSTMVVLFSIIFLRVTGRNIDGLAGALVSGFIVWTGIRAVKESSDPLIGKKPEAEFVQKIRDIVMHHEDVLGIHHIVIHDYGPSHRMISLHLEVPGEKNVFKMHSMIEMIEEELDKMLLCESVIHMDPVEVQNEELTLLKNEIAGELKNMDSNLEVHDFRLLHVMDQKDCLLFDVVIPQQYAESSEDLKSKIIKRIERQYTDYQCVIKIERDYT